VATGRALVFIGNDADNDAVDDDVGGVGRMRGLFCCLFLRCIIVLSCSQDGARY